MDEIQKVLIKAGRRDLAQLYYKKVAVSPPGWGGTVEHMKKHKEITNPWALAWYQKSEGHKPHYKERKQEEEEESK